MRKKYVIFTLLLFLCIFSEVIFAKTHTERLEKGEIIVEEIFSGDQLRGVKALAIIDAPIEEVWKVITDYENFKHFMPNCEESKILKKKGNTIYYKGRIKVLFLPITYHLKYTHTIKKDKMVDCWEKATGEYEYKGENPIELKKIYGCWTLERYKKTKTKSTYITHVEFKIPEGVSEYLVNKITNILLKVSTPGIIEATRKRVEEKRKEKGRK